MEPKKEHIYELSLVGVLKDLTTTKRDLLHIKEIFENDLEEISEDISTYFYKKFDGIVSEKKTLELSNNKKLPFTKWNTKQLAPFSTDRNTELARICHKD